MEYHWVGICKDCGYYFFCAYRPERGCCTMPNFIDVIKYHNIFDKYGKQGYAIYEQCKNCGWTQKAKPKKSIDSNIRDEFNEYRHEEWFLKRGEESKTLQNEARIVNSFWYKYDIYLSSEKWKKLRTIIFERDNQICQICRINSATEVHHLHYKNLYNEQLADLISICYTCHKEQHNKIML